MWTLVFTAAAALFWLLQVTIGPDLELQHEAEARWLWHAAQGLSVLAIVQVLRSLLGHLLITSWRTRGSATSDLLRSVATITLYLVALMLYLRFGLGQDISSVLATSALVSVIIGLALQPTLGHLFAGVSIEIEHPLNPGDYVRREDLEGQVVSLSWRSVYLRTDRSSTLVFPNSEFTSRTLEIIRRDQPFRHQLSFNVAADHPPGQVIRVAMRVLRSDLPGVCASPAPSVILQGNDPLTGTMRYAARMYTLRYLDRSSIGSAFLERLWYALSREGVSLLPPPTEWQAVPGHETEDGARLIPDPRAALDRFRPAPRGTRPPAPDSTVLPALAPQIRARLLATTSLLRYAAEERCDPFLAGVLLDGRLREERAPDPQRVEAALRALLAEVARLLRGAGRSGSAPGQLQLSHEVFQTLLAHASRALGPMARNLCEQIATLTEDPFLAYRAFAQSIPQPEQRQRFLANAPAQPSVVLHAGDLFGWANVLGLEAEPPVLRVTQGCSMLCWREEALCAALREVGAEQQQDLVSWLVRLAPGCEHLALGQLRERLRLA